MNTTITITPYLAEYIASKSGSCPGDPVSIHPDSDLYILIWDLMQRRPANIPPIDTGNLILRLPDRRVGKDPTHYNYLSAEAAKIISDKIRKLFNMELHQVMDDNLHAGSPEKMIDVAYRFICRYEIRSISEDALVKNYYRWRETVRPKSKRGYIKKKMYGNHSDIAPCFVR